MAKLRDANKPQSFQFGQAQISGFLALGLGIINVLAAIGFHFPEYATTPEIRAFYNVKYLRLLMSLTIFISIGCGCYTIVRGRFRRYGILGISLTSLCLFLGGPFIQVGEYAQNTPYVGLDWLILDLLGSGLIFIMLEKAFPHRKNKPILRPEWSLDMIHFIINHLIIGITLLCANSFAATAFGWARIEPVMNLINGLPFLAQLFLIILAADLIQYALHRSMHEIPAFWRIHAVHHCPEAMDWLSGSRLHFFELLATRVFVFLPIFVLGFGKSTIDTYVIIVGFQAVLNHSNIQINFRGLEKIFVTPQFHHWHHSSDQAALDRNYAAHFSFIDSLFRTRIKGEAEWPDNYGILGKNLPPTYLAHMTYPFKKSFWEEKSEAKGIAKEKGIEQDKAA